MWLGDPILFFSIIIVMLSHCLPCTAIYFISNHFFLHFQTCWTIFSCSCYFQPFTASPRHLKQFKASCSHSHSRPFQPFQTILSHFYTYPEIPAIFNYFLIFSAFSIISKPFHPFTVITNHLQICPAISSHAKPCQAILAI